MDFALAGFAQQPSAVLLAGSALVAAGLSLVLAVTLYWIRSRRRADARPLAEIDLVDEVPSVAPTMPIAPPKLDLSAIDVRLEEVEAQLERLHQRIDALIRQRETKVVFRSTSSPTAGGSKASDEERALREMVARSR